MRGSSPRPLRQGLTGSVFCSPKPINLLNMKYKHKLRKVYYVPSSIRYLSMVSLCIYAIVTLVFFLWLSMINCDLSIVERLLYFPKYCIGYVHNTGNVLLDLALTITKVFFFAAIVALFYEVYKYCIERHRIKIIEKAIYNNFHWTSSRKSGSEIKYVPLFKSFATIRARFGYTEDEIIRACLASDRLRVANLASTRPHESYPHDKLVVECFMRNAAYGCRINRDSRITIVVATTNFGLSKFGFYLALFGGFNFISKETTDHDTSERFFSVSQKSIDSNHEMKLFFSDVEELLKGQGSWVITLATIAGNEEERISIYHDKATKTSNYDSFCAKLPSSIKNVPIRCDETDFIMGKNNIVNHLTKGSDADGFDMRISNYTLVWNPKRMKIIKELAEAMCEAFGIKPNINATKIVSKKHIGFPADVFDVPNK